MRNTEDEDSEYEGVGRFLRVHGVNSLLSLILSNDDDWACKTGDKEVYVCSMTDRRAEEWACLCEMLTALGPCHG